MMVLVRVRACVRACVCVSCKNAGFFHFPSIHPTLKSFLQSTEASSPSMNREVSPPSSLGLAPSQTFCTAANGERRMKKKLGKKSSEVFLLSVLPHALVPTFIGRGSAYLPSPVGEDDDL